MQMIVEKQQPEQSDDALWKKRTEMNERLSICRLHGKAEGCHSCR